MKRMTKLLTGKQKISNDLLRRWNIILFVLFLLQGAAILLFSTTKNFPVTTSYQTTDSLQSAVSGHTVLGPATHQLLTINLVYLVALFLFVGAAAHLSAATVYKSRYNTNLKAGINRLRWVEYALSGGIMLIVLGILVGISDISNLLMLLVLGVVGSLLSLIIETDVLNAKTTINWPNRVILFLSCLVPWAVILLNILGTNIFGNGHVQAYIYWIYVTVFTSFVLISVNTFLHLTKRGKWADHNYSERWYMILGLVSMSILAWQVFMGLLRP